MFEVIFDAPMVAFTATPLVPVTTMVVPVKLALKAACGIVTVAGTCIVRESPLTSVTTTPQHYAGSW